MSEQITGDLVAGVDMTQVLPPSVFEPLKHQVAALLASDRPADQMPAFVVTWMAPMIAERDHAIKKLRWLHAELVWRLDEARAQHRDDLAEIAFLSEQVASVGRGMSRLLGELAEARTVAGLDGGS